MPPHIYGMPNANSGGGYCQIEVKLRSLNNTIKTNNGCKHLHLLKWIFGSISGVCGIAVGVLGLFSLLPTQEELGKDQNTRKWLAICKNQWLEMPETVIIWFLNLRKGISERIIHFIQFEIIQVYIFPLITGSFLLLFFHSWEIFGDRTKGLLGFI